MQPGPQNHRLPISGFRLQIMFVPGTLQDAIECSIQSTNLNLTSLPFVFTPNRHCTAVALQQETPMIPATSSEVKSMYPKDRTLDLSLGEEEFLTVDIIWHACRCFYAILLWPISPIQEKLQTTIKPIVTRLWRDSQFCQFSAGRLQKLETEPSHGHETFVSLAAVVEPVFISNLATAASSSTSPQQLRTTSLNLLLFSFRNLTVWECRVHDDDEDDEETVSSRSSFSSGFILRRYISPNSGDWPRRCLWYSGAPFFFLVANHMGALSLCSTAAQEIKSVHSSMKQLHLWVVVIHARCREKQWTQAAAACWSSSPQRCPVDYSIPLHYISCYSLQIDCRCLIISCGSVHLQSSSSACLFLWQYLITLWRQEDLLQPAGV